ncbi:hypothetical protein HG547_20470, partial [Shewanella sp. DNRA4]|nr:hypothetical protein [Shewanella sp. DNRA4]
GQIVVKSGYTSSANAIEAIEFTADSSGASNLNAAAILSAAIGMYGTEDNDVINGTSLADSLYGGSGNDTLNGGNGDDIYVFGFESGQDIVNNYNSSTSSIDIARFDDVSIEDLWFSRDGNNLQINVIGTTDQVDVSNWYSGVNYQLDKIHVGDSVLLNTQVELLVSAMASFEVPSGVGSIVSQDIQDSLKPVLVENWHTF